MTGKPIIYPSSSSQLGSLKQQHTFLKLCLRSEAKPWMGQKPTEMVGWYDSHKRDKKFAKLVYDSE